MRRIVVSVLAGVVLCTTSLIAQAKDEPAKDVLWSKQCAKAPDGKQDICVVQQFVSAQPGNRQLLLAQFSFTGQQGKPRLLLTAPLGVLLPTGLTLSIDGNKSLTVPFEMCDPGGCRSIIDMDTAALDQFRKGKALMVRYLGQDQKPLDLPVKLEGLDTALKSIAP